MPNQDCYFLLSLNAPLNLNFQFYINFIPMEKRAYILKIVSAVLDEGSMTLCLPTPGTAQYNSYLFLVINFN